MLGFIRAHLVHGRLLRPVARVLTIGARSDGFGALGLLSQVLNFSTV